MAAGIEADVPARAPRTCLHVVLHDFAGHPFQAELSRELARRAHRVTHQYVLEVPGPKGSLMCRTGDPARLQFDAVRFGRPIRKAPFAARVMDEIHVGRAIGQAILACAPDLAILCNLPALSLPVVAAALRGRVPYVVWVQDLWSASALPGAGALTRLLRKPYAVLEDWSLRGAAGIVVISEAFRGLLASRGIDSTVIPNWAPLSEITPRPRDNPWARAHGLVGRRVLMYTGTLGLKHDPDALVRLAEALRGDEVRFVVTSFGEGYRRLEQAKRELGLDTLLLLEPQPWEVYPDVLASADLLIAVLTEEGGRFSVPSKVLSYLAAGRAVLLYGPPDNDAARAVREAGAGVVVPYGDVEGLVRTARELLADGARLARMARAARRYAEDRFDIERIADRFEQVLRTALRRGGDGVERTTDPNGRMAS